MLLWLLFLANVAVPQCSCPLQQGDRIQFNEDCCGSNDYVKAGDEGTVYCVGTGACSGCTVLVTLDNTTGVPDSHEGMNYNCQCPDLGAVNSLPGNGYMIECGILDPTVPAETPVPAPTPTAAPSPNLTVSPTPNPTVVPTASPTVVPPPSPTVVPTPSPTVSPTLTSPTMNHIPALTGDPTQTPTIHPSPESSHPPSLVPTTIPMPEMTVGNLITECSLQNGTFYLEIRANSDEQQSKTCDEGGSNVEDDSEAFDPSGSLCVLDGFSIIVEEFPTESASYCFPVEFLDEDIVSNIITIEPSDSLDDPEVYEFIIPYSEQDVCEIESDEHLTCQWYDEETKSWTTSGCELTESHITISDRGYFGAKCRCSHLTAFAILQDTAQLKDTCNLSTVLGHVLWFIFACFYLLLGLVAAYRLHFIWLLRRSGTTSTDTPFLIHCLIVCVSAVNFIGCLASFTNSAATIHVLSIAWALFYILSFWVYSIIIVAWATLCHSSDLLISRLKKICIVVQALLTVGILVMFALISFSEPPTVRKVVLIGSVIIGGFCLFLAFSFVVYGTFLITKLVWASSQFGDSLSLVEAHELKRVARRISIVSVVMSVAFVVQSVILIISAVATHKFFVNFAVLQPLYLVMDLLLLSAAIYLFLNLKRKRLSVHSYAGHRTSNISHGGDGSIELEPQET